MIALLFVLLGGAPARAEDPPVPTEATAPTPPEADDTSADATSPATSTALQPSTLDPQPPADTEPSDPPSQPATTPAAAPRPQPSPTPAATPIPPTPVTPGAAPPAPPTPTPAPPTHADSPTPAPPTHTDAPPPAEPAAPVHATDDHVSAPADDAAPGDGDPAAPPVPRSALVIPSPIPIATPGATTKAAAQGQARTERNPLIPRFALRGPWYALLLGLLTALCVLGAGVSGRARRELMPTGVLPAAAMWTQQTFRFLAVFFALGVAGAIVPPGLEAVLPLVVIAAALALGWSSRDFLPDLVAGAILSLEHRVRRGQWIEGKDFSGRIEAIGIRATWIRDGSGRQLVLPNRRLTDGALVTDRGRWPALTTSVAVPPDCDPALVRTAITRACLRSPWIAPIEAIDMVQSDDSGSRWNVRVRLIEARFADRFEGALREAVREHLTRPRSEPP